MSSVIRFTIPGRPVPKGGCGLAFEGGKAYVHTPEATKVYE